MISTTQLSQITKKLTLLYVEDETSLITQMLEIFNVFFKEVHVSQNGQLGLDAFNAKILQGNAPYDLIISDINMPIMNGIDMIQEIYKIIPEQAVIVTSAYNDAEYLIPLLNIGVSGFLVKPLTMDGMIKSLYSVCKALTNERLLQKQHKELKKLNSQLKDKNIAIEKSLRIIEGMYHKEQINKKTPVDISYSLKEKQTIKEELSQTAKSLTNIEFLICNISMKYHLNGIENELLSKLSKEISNYSNLLDSRGLHESLKKSLQLLADTVSIRPQCTKEKELSRIFTMLESFFFIYTKWQNQWKSIDDEKFKISCQSIEHELNTIISLWKCKL